MSEALFDKATIELALGDVAARLAVHGAEPGVLIVVGGSFMALHGLREATRDVDSITRVLGPPADYVLVMKLYAARGEVDRDDMVRLWPRCNFTSPAEAAR